MDILFLWKPLWAKSRYGRCAVEVLCIVTISHFWAKGVGGGGGGGGKNEVEREQEGFSSMLLYVHRNHKAY